MLHDSEIVITGGAENMSLSPHAVRGIRFGVKLGLDVVVRFVKTFNSLKITSVTGKLSI